MARPIVVPITEEMYEALGPWTRRDEETDWHLLRFLNALGVQLQVTEDIVRDTDEGPGWSALLDIDRVPAWAIPWLAQFVGVVVDVNLAEADQRLQVKAASAMKRGTRQAFIDAVKTYLTGEKRVELYERDGSPYRFRIRTYLDESPTYSYDRLKATYATYADLRAAHPTYTDISDVDLMIEALQTHKPAGLIFTHELSDLEPITRRAVAAWRARDYSGTGPLLDLSGRGHDARFPGGVNDPLFLDYTGEQYAYLPGTAGNHLRVEDNPALDVASDIVVEAEVTRDDWSDTATHTLASKWTGSLGWIIWVQGTGGIRIISRVSGTSHDTTVTGTGVVPADLTPGKRAWLRVRMNPTGNLIQVFYSLNDRASWTQWGSDTPYLNGAHTLEANTAPLEIGTYNNGTYPWKGRMYAVQLREGLNGLLVYDWEASDLAEPFGSSARKAVIPAARSTFVRTTTAYLNGVEVAAGTPRYAYSVNRLTRTGSQGTSWYTYNNAGNAQPVTRSTVADGPVPGTTAERLEWSVANTSTKGLYIGSADAMPSPRWDRGETYIISWYARAGLTSPTTMMVYWNNPGPTNQTVLLNPTLTGEWQRYAFRVTMPSKGDDGPFISVVNGTGGTGWLEMGALQVQKAPAAAGTGDIKPWRPGGPSGVLVENGTSNLETTTNGRHSGLTAFGTTPPTVAVVADPTAPAGGEAYEVVFPNPVDTNYAGSRAQADGTWTLVRDGVKSYTTTAWLDTNDDASFTVYHTGGVGLAAMAPTGRMFGKWYEWTSTSTPASGTNTTEYFVIFATTTAAAGKTVRIMMPQVEQKTYRTSWHPGGVARNDDELFIPLDAVPAPTAAGTIEFEYVTGPFAVGDGDAANDLTLGRPGTDGFLLRRKQSGTHELEYYTGTGTVRIETTATTYYAPGLRLSVAVAWDANGVSFYIDGVLVGSLASTWAVPASAGYLHLQVGGRSIDMSNLTADQLRISSVKKTAAEVAAAVGTWWSTEPASTWLQEYRSTLEGEYGGQTIVRRATTGRKTAIVDRDMLLFGGDDYLEVTDHDDLDFDTDESLTLVAAYRYHNAANFALLGSYTGANADRGVGLQQTVTNVQPIWADGTVADNSGGSGLPPTGTAITAMAIRDVTADRWYAFHNSVARPAGAPDASTASLAGTQAFRIGRRAGAGTNYADMEFLGAAVFREALSDADLASLAQEFGVA